MGHFIIKQHPDFDPCTYGYPKLSDLVTATTLFDLDRRSPGDGKASVIYARDRRRDKTPAAVISIPSEIPIGNPPRHRHVDHAREIAEPG